MALVDLKSISHKAQLTQAIEKDNVDIDLTNQAAAAIASTALMVAE
jgi:hypothetical protein